MIVDTMEHLEAYGALGEHFRTAVEYLKKTDMRSLPVGKHEVDGEKVFILSQENHLTVKEMDWEAHARYADIQIILEGCERFGWGYRGTLNDLDVDLNYADDPAAYEDTDIVLIFISNGSMAGVINCTLLEKDLVTYRTELMGMLISLSGETEEVLSLCPAAGRPLENSDRHTVPSVLHILRELEFCRCETILTVTDELPVQPEGKAALHTLKGDKNPFTLHLFGNQKIFQITSRWIVFHRDLTGHELFFTVPGIGNVDVLRACISLHLYVCRNRNIIPACRIIITLLKSGNRLQIVVRVTELPESVQTVKKTALLRMPDIILPENFLLGAIEAVIRMCFTCMNVKNLRIRNHPVVKGLF